MFAEKENKMGTNYYVQTKKCKECGHTEELHIGKSSCGWHFSFHALDETTTHPEIKSFKQWQDFIKARELTIVDEYQEEIPLEKFISFVEAKQMNPDNIDHKKYSEKNYVSYAHTWFYDPEGYTFTYGEFS